MTTPLTFPFWGRETEAPHTNSFGLMSITKGGLICEIEWHWLYEFDFTLYIFKGLGNGSQMFPMVLRWFMTTLDWFWWLLLSVWPRLDNHGWIYNFKDDGMIWAWFYMSLYVSLPLQLFLYFYFQALILIFLPSGFCHFGDQHVWKTLWRPTMYRPKY